MARGAYARTGSVVGLLPVLFLLACGGSNTEDLFGPRGSGGDSANSGVGGRATPPEGGKAGQSAGVSGAAAGSGTGGNGATGAASGGSGAGSAGDAGEAGGDSGGSSGSSGIAGSGQGGSTPTAGTGTPGGTGGAATCVADGSELCDGLDNDCNGEIDETKSCPAGCVGQAIGGQGYMFCEVERSFALANAACGKAGMRLLWIESAEENSAIADAVLALGFTAERMWLGAGDADSEGEWHWVDVEGETHAAFWYGESVEEGGVPIPGQFVNWGAGRPNDSDNSDVEDCATFTLDRSGLELGTWNDDDCSPSWPFVCEKL